MLILIRQHLCLIHRDLKELGKMIDDSHQKMLKSTFNEVLIQEIAKRLKNPTLDEIDLIMYFGDKETREKIVNKVVPEMIRELHIIDLIRLEENFNSFLNDFSYSWWIINKEIKKRKKIAGI